jgi:hypothetical protein
VATFVLVAACHEPPGLTLEVMTDDDAITRVELLVGRHCDGICPGAVRPEAFPPLDANLYVTDDDRVWTATPERGIAGFRIEASHDKRVSIIVAIGYDDLGEPRATAILTEVRIPSGRAALWRVVLTPAEPLVASPGDAPVPEGTERVKTWRVPGGVLPSCVVIERWHDGKAHRVAIGPNADRDCDEVPAPECAPWIFQATREPATIETADCLVARQGSFGAICALGGPVCDERGNASASCAALDREFCAPSMMCACTPWDAPCLAGMFTTTPHAAPHVWCVVPTDNSGQPCVDRTRVQDVDLSPLLGGNSTRCLSVGVHDLSVPIGSFEREAQIGNGMLEVQFREACAVDLEWAGTLSLTAKAEMALAAIELDNGRHLVVPIGMKGDATDCLSSDRAFCEARGPSVETMYECAAPAPPAGACSASPPCTGPICHNQCCATGEYCDPSYGCRCGSGPGCGQEMQCTGSLGPVPSCGGSCCTPGKSECIF